MANCAIVVGLSRYAKQRAFPKGAGREALKMHDRLLSASARTHQPQIMLFGCL